MSLRDQILSANDLGMDAISVPEWGVGGGVKKLSGLERAKLVDEVNKYKEETNANNVRKLAVIVVYSFVDESGARVFSDDDVEAVANKEMEVLDRIATKALEVNGLNGDSSVKDAAKN